MIATIAQLYRYPVKGLSPEPLLSVVLAEGEGLPNDRRFAIAHGRSRFDPTNPGWVDRANFVVVANAPLLTALKTKYDDATGVLTIRHDGGVVTGNLSSHSGRHELEAFLAGYVGERMPGPFRIVEAPGQMLTDAPEKLVSIISAATCGDLAEKLGAVVDQRRFRGNLIIEGSEPWAEFDWLGRTLRVGGARLEVVERIGRCAATNADPDSGERDMNIPRTLQRRFGHFDCGIYARVTARGAVSPGDCLHLL